ncbi:MAG: MFS transporter, partial [Thiovulaceae bacterium]|nr:MFS transporter [Sulfurimonadaceae bacterium]
MNQSLFRVVGFTPYIIVMFLNAFTDLGHKITIHNTLIKSFDGSELVVYSTIINAMILLPFVLLFTPAGYLSDKYPKNLIMRFSAWFAVVITLGITASYYLGEFWISFGLTFLLALQSALYSPAKYGYVKELLGVSRLARGNAVVQAVTIIAILVGTAGYTALFEPFLSDPNMTDKALILQDVTHIGWFLVGGSLLELFLA